MPAISAGPGLSQIRLGERGGDENNDVAPHSHGVPVSSEIANERSPIDGIPAAKNRSSDYRTPPGDAEWETTEDGTTGVDRDPFLGLQCIIALQGIYPSR